MRWLMPVGVLLIVIGLGGSIGACYQAGTDSVRQAASEPDAFDGGVPAQQADEPSGMQMIVAPLAGLALALGIEVGGGWDGALAAALPSEVRPANPWSDQPADKGDPPIGLV